MLPDRGILADLPRATREALAAVAREVRLSRGELLFEEGSPSSELFVVVSGRLEVVKRAETGAEHRIHEIGPGEPVGEIGFFDRWPRSAAVKALEDVVLIAIPNDVVARDAGPLVVRLGERLAERLRRSGEDEANAARHRLVMGDLLVKIILLLSGYALLLATLPKLSLDVTSSTMISLPLIGLFGFGSWRFMRKTGYPLARFGLGARHFMGSLLECAVFTPMLCGLLVGLKWVAIRVHEPWRSLPLFERTDVWIRLSEPHVQRLLLIYLVSSAVQELIVRCALQSSLDGLLDGPRKHVVSIFVCALVFSVNHLHMAYEFALAAFVPGAFWGWLFARRPNLVGPVLSHFAVGAFVFFFLGMSLP